MCYNTRHKWREPLIENGGEKMTNSNNVKEKREQEELTHIFTYYNIFLQAWTDSADSCDYASYDEAVKAAINCDPYWEYHNIYRIDLYKNKDGAIQTKKVFICRLPSKRRHSTAEYRILGVKTENGIDILKSDTYSIEIENIDELKEMYPNLGIYKVKVGFDDNNNLTYDYTLEFPIKGVTLEEQNKTKKGKRK